MDLQRTDEDDLGFTHYRYQQTYKGVKVEGAEMLVQFGSYLQAQEPTSKGGINQAWISGGFGFAGGNNLAGVGSGIIVTYHPRGRVVSMRYMSIISMTMIEIQEGFVRYETVKDVGVTYGVIEKNKWLYTSAATGVSFLAGEKRVGVGDANSRLEDFSTVGIPYELQLFITPIPALGVGLSFSGSLNNEASYAGILLCMQYGLLR